MREVPQTFTTTRLLLRPITASDLPNIYRGLSDPKVIAHYGVSFDSLEATQAQMDWFAQQQQCWWAICSPDGDTFYGAGGLNDIDTQQGKAEIGLWLLPQFWGRGIMAEALPIIADYGLTELGLHRIEGFVDSNNENCKKAMAKVDFQHEKTIPNFEVKDGKSIDVDVFVKLR